MDKESNVNFMVRIAIVEDDETFANGILSYIRQYSAERNIKTETKHFACGLDFISDYAPVYDIILMDIEMPHLDGMETAKKLRKMGDRAQLIFITNMAQYAVSGYEVEALSFIVKPVDYFNFSMKLDKAVGRLQLEKNDYITIKMRDMAVKIYIRDIKYVEVFRHKIIYHTFRDNIEVTGSMVETENKLAAYGFARCNNCWLVNLRHVSFVKNNVLTVADEELRISRNKKQEFMQKLAAYFCGGGEGS